MDIQSTIKNVMNPSPVILTSEEMASPYAAKNKVQMLLKKMAGSDYILLVDKYRIPKRMVSVREILESHSVRQRLTVDRFHKILVVGGAGYLGSVLVRKMLQKGYCVKVLDNLMYGSSSLKDMPTLKNLMVIPGDMRHISTLVSALKDTEAVVNLAAVVGDPACKQSPEMAFETNYLANKSLAEACKYNQINRYIYASTCSVYGAMKGHAELDENAPLNPVSLYARSKIHSEQGILSLEDENFSPTILRMSTLYGYSPRMRFDLVVNTMTKTAVCEKQITVHGGGKQWRPLLNVDDAAEAYMLCLEAPIDKIKGQIFNVGSSRQNFQIMAIAKAVQSIVPGAKLKVDGSTADARNYVVSFKKIEKVLKFHARQTVEASVQRIQESLVNGEIKNPDDARYYNVESV
jgi:nucleoside-diphosphate-sugar epimerase